MSTTVQGKLLGIDYGERRIGLAISSEDHKYVFKNSTIDTNETTDYIESISRICQEENIQAIVVGMPLDQHGQPSKTGEDVNKFIIQLKGKIAIPISTEDERFTSKRAGQLMREAGKKEKYSKGNTDQEAAKLILQSHIEKRYGIQFIG